MAMSQLESELPAPIERIRWSFLRDPFLRAWEQGQHIAIIGPTGQGKTTLAIDLLENRVKYLGASVCIIATKQTDSQLSKLARNGWRIVREWPPTYEERTTRRIIFWPKYGRASTSAKANRQRYLEAFDGILSEHNWTVYLDEVIYVTEQLRLRHLLDEYWNTGRSSGITLVASSQGATWVPRAMMTQQSWVACFKMRDFQVVQRTAEIAGDRKRYVPEINSLRNHEFLLVETLSGDSYISKVGT
jgi:hypothetical protein